MGGKEYIVPSTTLPTNARFSPAVPQTAPIHRPRHKHVSTTIDACFFDNNPAAIGRYGLLILSISTSVIWFNPVM